LKRRRGPERGFSRASLGQRSSGRGTPRVVDAFPSPGVEVTERRRLLTGKG
jgi:hypothetical protein